MELRNKMWRWFCYLIKINKGHTCISACVTCETRFAATNMHILYKTYLLKYTVQITFIFIGQTHLVFGKRVCTCVTKHSNAFRTFLNWLKNSKRVWHVWHVWHVWNANFDVWSVIERCVGLVSVSVLVSETAGEIHLSDDMRCKVYRHLSE